MIDYDKLQKALALTEQFQEETDHAVWLEIGWGFGTKCTGSIALTINGKESEFDSPDELIVKLSSLTKAPSGYVVGQTVWKLNDNHEPQVYIIEQVDGNSVEKYTINDYNDWYREEELWPSLEALIEHQLSYWAKQAVIHTEEFTGCLHEDDGNCYLTQPSQTKCRKCGELYR
tara:strand:+ start:7148 stop:7666 length:519 start_codon:yes stop_codon:yes gene_type:complete